MKVLQINSVCGIRSTGKICTDLSDVLHKRGDECLILYGRDKAPDSYRNVAKKIGGSFGVKLHALFTRLFDSAGFHSNAATKKIIQEIKKYNPDIIHLHNLHGYYLNIKMLFDYLKNQDKPVVWTLHDCWAFTGHCSHFSFVGCEKWKKGCFRCPQHKEYPTSLFFDNSKKNYNKKKNCFTGVKNLCIVTPSRWLAETAKESFLSEYPIVAIPNGIDLELFKPTPGDFRDRYDLKDKKIILGVASSWGEKKGLDDFLELSKIIDEDTRIVLVGLKDYESKSMPNNIICIQEIRNSTELAQIYTAADIFFNPSREETMGLTTVEAMACGTFSIVYPLTALPEVISEGAGCIINFKDLSAVIDVLKDQTKLLPENCIKQASIYSKYKMFESYMKIYEELKK